LVESKAQPASARVGRGGKKEAPGFALGVIRFVVVGRGGKKEAPGFALGVIRFVVVGRGGKKRSPRGVIGGLEV